jgi:putative transposase
MKFVFVDAEKATWPVVTLCSVLGVSTSGYYAWRSRPPSARTRANAHLVAEIRAAHKAGRRAYGSPRVTKVLRDRGHRLSAKRGARLMRQEGIVARKKKRFRKTTDPTHAQPIAPNLVDRKFKVEAPNRTWVTDVTYVWTLEGWLYLAAILDLCSRRVVGWATSANNDTQLALVALHRAVDATQPGRGLVHHSDRGSVYASNDYGSTLDALDAAKSMSRKGDCWDNAVAESFFATIKGELIDHETFVTRDEATSAIGDYIDNFYNPHRLHSSLGYVSPIQFELSLQVAKHAA